MDQTASPPAPFPLALRRRTLLVGIGASALTAGLGIEHLAFAATTSPPPAEFLHMSRFVTGASLTDGAAVNRAWTQLAALDAGFPAAVARLDAAVRQGGLTTMADFLASALAKDAALIKTATTLTSAFYLGFTGTPVDHRMVDDTGFVTFAGALMWRPTIDATVIPTFARGHTDYWIDPPAGTPARAPQRQPQWQGSSPSSES